MGNKNKEPFKRATETMREMGWERKTLKGRVEKRKEKKERSMEDKQEEAYPEKSTKRILTGGRKEIKKEKIDKPRISTADKKRKEEEEEIKEKIKRAVEAWRTL